MRLHWPFCHVGMAESGAGDNKFTDVGVLPGFACIYRQLDPNAIKRSAAHPVVESLQRDVICF